jgi:hypothetical protein
LVLFKNDALIRWQYFLKVGSGHSSDLQSLSSVADPGSGMEGGRIQNREKVLRIQDVFPDSGSDPLPSRIPDPQHWKNSIIVGILKATED